MTSVQQTIEYGWKTAAAAHSHNYLLPAVDDALTDVCRRRGQPGAKLRIFDAGCGNGFLAGHLLAKGHEVSGCDSSIEGVSVARVALPTCRFEVMSVYDPLSDTFGSEWDVIVSTEVIEHLYDPRSLVRNVFTMLRPGGTFIVTTPYHGYLKNLVLATTGKLDNHFTALWDGGHIKFWSLRTLTALLTEAGFHDVAFRGAGRLPLLWKSMVLSAYKA